MRPRLHSIPCRLPECAIRVKDGKGARARIAPRGRRMSTESLEALYEAHAKTVYWAAYGVSRDEQAAADAVQNVFLNAYRHLEALAGMTSEQRRAWLYRSAVNNSIDMLRRNKRTVPTEDAGVLEPDSALGPEARAEQNETSATVKRHLNALPEKYREPLYLYYFAEMDYHQIAKILDMSEGTLKSRMSRGREMLKKELQKGGELYAR